MTEDDDIGLHLPRLVDDDGRGPAPDQHGADGQVGVRRMDLPFGGLDRLAVGPQDLVLGFVRSGRTSTVPDSPANGTDGRRDADDPDVTASVPRQRRDEISGLVGRT